jgi:hypothetical protein
MKKEAIKATRPQAQQKPADDTGVVLEAPRLRIASKEQFEKAQKKTRKLHAGLFQRLAK